MFFFLFCLLFWKNKAVFVVKPLELFGARMQTLHLTVKCNTVYKNCDPSQNQKC